MKPLLVYDTSVVMHQILDLTRDKAGSIKNPVSNKERDERIRLGYQLFNTLFWIGNFPHKELDILWVGDYKESAYWRRQFINDWLGTLAVDDPRLTKSRGVNKGLPSSARKGYKGNRDTCPYQQWVHKRVASIIKPLMFEGCEADDVAAAVTATFTDRHIYLATTDSDWLQLVSDTVTWVGVDNHIPRIRDTIGAVDWFTTKISKEPVFVQDLIDTKDIRNIVDWKVLRGDVADNLPKDSPRRAIDLYDPPQEYKLWLRDGFKEQAESKMITYTSEGGYDIYEDWITQFGMMRTPEFYWQ
jgi:hypothetical protein